MFLCFRLDVMLAKENEGFMWTEVVVGNTRGEYVADPDQARLIHERLAHLTSDALVCLQSLNIITDFMP